METSVHGREVQDGGQRARWQSYAHEAHVDFVWRGCRVIAPSPELSHHRQLLVGILFTDLRQSLCIYAAFQSLAVLSSGPNEGKGWVARYLRCPAAANGEHFRHRCASLEGGLFARASPPEQPSGAPCRTVAFSSRREPTKAAVPDLWRVILPERRSGDLQEPRKRGSTGQGYSLQLSQCA